MSPSRSRVVAGLALAAGAAVLFAPRVPAVAGGLLLAFVLPGLALLTVFRGRALTAVERTVLTPVLSMGALIVTGLVLHVAGLRIERLSWTVATVVVTVAAAVAAQPLRIHRLWAVADAPPSGAAPAVISVVPATLPENEQPAAPERNRRGLPLRHLLPLLLVAGLLGGASWLSFQTSRSTDDTTVTALSAAPPGPVDPAGNRTVRVSATGLLAADGPYSVTVAFGTTTIRRSVPVTGDGSWSETMSMPGTQRTTVNLYRAGDTTAYRTLTVRAVD